jgi:hypothetical protein
MTKTLSKEDWTKITSSFDIMNQKFPYAIAAEDTPTYKHTSIKGVKEQLQEGSVGGVIFYIDYLTLGTTPKVSKCKIICESNA